MSPGAAVSLYGSVTVHKGYTRMSMCVSMLSNIAGLIAWEFITEFEGSMTSYLYIAPVLTGIGAVVGYNIPRADPEWKSDSIDRHFTLAPQVSIPLPAFSITQVDNEPAYTMSISGVRF